MDILDQVVNWTHLRKTRIFITLFVQYHMESLTLHSFFPSKIEIQKALIKLSKEKGCEVIGKWRKACVRHLYWSVTSTMPNQGEVILAKFQCLLSHIINKHKELPNRLFNKCAHGPITSPRVWLTKGTYGTVFEHLYWFMNALVTVNDFQHLENSLFFHLWCLVETIQVMWHK